MQSLYFTYCAGGHLSIKCRKRTLQIDCRVSPVSLSLNSNISQLITQSWHIPYDFHIVFQHFTTADASGSKSPSTPSPLCWHISPISFSLNLARIDLKRERKSIHPKNMIISNLPQVLYEKLRLSIQVWQNHPHIRVGRVQITLF